MYFVLFLAALVAIWLYVDFVYPFVVYPLTARRHKCGSIPMFRSVPFGLPVTLRVLSKIRKEQLLRFIQELEMSKPTKTALRQTLFSWNIGTREPENVKAVLSTKFNDFSLESRNSRMRPVFGSGIFTQDGAAWKHSREMLKPQFSKDQISRLEHTSHHVDMLIDIIHKRGNRVELQHLFHLLTMDSATDFLFGQSVQSLQFSENSRGVKVTDPVTNEEVYSADFVESYTWLNKFALERIVMNDMDWILVLAKPEHRKHLRKAHVFIDHFVHEALEETKDYAPGDDSIKESYVFSHELAKETRDPKVLRDQLFNILIAGRDTTASALSYSFYYFAQNPDVWKKVQDEAKEVFPDGDSSFVTYEDLRKLKYLHMVVKEVLRLSPAVPLNMRMAVRDTFLPRGGGPNQDQPIFVPKGTTVNYPTRVIHRDPDIYGEDAEMFRPERWAPENKRPNSPMYTWGYIPFNGGPRICLGQQFALTEIYLTISKFALAFDTVKPDVNFNPEVIDRLSVTAMVGGNGVPVILG